MEEKELYPHQKEILEELRSMNPHSRMLAVMSDRPTSTVIRATCDGIYPERLLGREKSSPCAVNTRYPVVDYLGIIGSSSDSAFRAGMGSKSNISLALMFEHIQKLSQPSPLQSAIGAITYDVPKLTMLAKALGHTKYKPSCTILPKENYYASRTRLEF